MQPPGQCFLTEFRDNYLHYPPTAEQQRAREVSTHELATDSTLLGKVSKEPSPGHAQSHYLLHILGCYFCHHEVHRRCLAFAVA